MDFIVYSRSGCPYCDKIKVVLGDVASKTKSNLTTYELGVDFSREEFYSEFGEGSTFPQVVYDTNHIGGCSDTIKYLQENNML